MTSRTSLTIPPRSRLTSNTLINPDVNITMQLLIEKLHILKKERITRRNMYCVIATIIAIVNSAFDINIINFHYNRMLEHRKAQAIKQQQEQIVNNKKGEIEESMKKSPIVSDHDSSSSINRSSSTDNVDSKDADRISRTTSGDTECTSNVMDLVSHAVNTIMVTLTNDPNPISSPTSSTLPTPTTTTTTTVSKTNSSNNLTASRTPVHPKAPSLNILYHTLNNSSSSNNNNNSSSSSISSEEVASSPLIPACVKSFLLNLPVPVDGSEETVEAPQPVNVQRLRQHIETSKDKIAALQREIRISAEYDNNEQMRSKMKARHQLAVSCNNITKSFYSELESHWAKQSIRVFTISTAIYYLQQFSKSLRATIPKIPSIPKPDINANKANITYSWSQWLDDLDLCWNSYSSVDTSSLDQNMSQLLQDMKLFSEKLYQCYEIINNSNSNSQIENEEVITTVSIDIDNLQADFTKHRNALQDLIIKEFRKISSATMSDRSLINQMFKNSYLLLSGLLIQNEIDRIEMENIQIEMTKWSDSVELLCDDEALTAKVDSIMKESARFDDEVMKVEVVRIDAKSLFDKKEIRIRRRIKITEAAAEEMKKEFAELREKLTLAEAASREKKKEVNSWLKEQKKFALAVAPELFHILPDLRSPGTVIGDGRFAGKVNFARRRIQEYTDVGLLLDANQIPHRSRHILFRANFRGEDVVLKGFIVHDAEHAKGLERELTSLSRLRCDNVIRPRAIIDGSSMRDLSHTVLIEYPYLRGGSLNDWLRSHDKAWDLQNVARQILYGIMYLHDHGVVHKDIKPSNILISQDGNVQLADFELSHIVDTNGEEEQSQSTSIVIRTGPSGFFAPEVDSGGPALFASDMYSFGAILFFIHFPDQFHTLVPGCPVTPVYNDVELLDLMRKLLRVDHTLRPSAATSLLHGYFHNSFIERLIVEGELVEQDKKLDAVRNLISRVRSENELNVDRLVVHRHQLVDSVLQYFRDLPLAKMRSKLKVVFHEEAGVDEGGLLTEMFRIFFDSLFQGHGNLFVGSEAASTRDYVASEGDNVVKSQSILCVLPMNTDKNPLRIENLRAFGRALVKALYEGRRIGNKLCPAVFKYITGATVGIRDLQMFDPETTRSLQWTLATSGVASLGLHFESIGAPDLGPVNDSNKIQFVKLKVEEILVKCRKPHLEAIKLGFSEALKALSSDASPFLSLISHTDWRVLLCGESTAVTAAQIIAVTSFSGFPRTSLVPQWTKEVIMSLKDDDLLKFLVFVTGSPSLPVPVSASPESSFTMLVRRQPLSDMLPVAHTCFFHLDMPEYRDKDTLRSKLVYAVQNGVTFDVV